MSILKITNSIILCWSIQNTLIFAYESCQKELCKIQFWEFESKPNETEIIKCSSTGIAGFEINGQTLLYVRNGCQIINNSSLVYGLIQIRPCKQPNTAGHMYEVIQIFVANRVYSEVNISIEYYGEKQYYKHCFNKQLRYNKNGDSEIKWIPILNYKNLRKRKFNVEEIQHDGAIIIASVKNASGNFHEIISLFSLYDLVDNVHDGQCRFPFVYSSLLHNEDIVMVESCSKVENRTYHLCRKELDNNKESLKTYRESLPRKITQKKGNFSVRHLYYIISKENTDEFSTSKEIITPWTCVVLPLAILLIVVFVVIITYTNRAQVRYVVYLYCECSKHSPNKKVLECLIKFLDDRCYIKRREEVKMTWYEENCNVLKRLVSSKPWDCVIFILFPFIDGHDIEWERDLEERALLHNNAKKKIVLRLPKQLNQKVDEEQCPWSSDSYKEFLLLQDFKNFIMCVHPCIFPKWLQKYLRPRLWIPLLLRYLQEAMLTNTLLKELNIPTLHSSEEDKLMHPTVDIDIDKLDL